MGMMIVVGNFYSSSSEEMVHERNFNCNVTESARDTEDDLSATWEVSGQRDNNRSKEFSDTPRPFSERGRQKEENTLDIEIISGMVMKLTKLLRTRSAHQVLKNIK